MRTRTAPWDYQRRPEPATVDQLERQIRYVEWHMSHPNGPSCDCLKGSYCPVHDDLPSFDQAQTSIHTQFESARARISIQAAQRFQSSSIDYFQASNAQYRELCAALEQAKAIARAIHRYEVNLRITQ